MKKNIICTYIKVILICHVLRLDFCAFKRCIVCDLVKRFGGGHMSHSTIGTLHCTTISHCLEGNTRRTLLDDSRNRLFGSGSQGVWVRVEHGLHLCSQTTQEMPL